MQITVKERECKMLLILKAKVADMLLSQHLFSGRCLLKLQREAISAESALEQKCLARHNLLLGCKIQGLPIILLSGSLDEISEVQVRHGCGSKHVWAFAAQLLKHVQDQLNFILFTFEKKTHSMNGLFWMIVNDCLFCSWTQIQKVLQPLWASMRGRRSSSLTTLSSRHTLGSDNSLIFIKFLF